MEFYIFPLCRVHLYDLLCCMFTTRAAQNPNRHARHLSAVPDPTPTQLTWVPPGRTLHLDDVENLMGGPCAGPDALRVAREQYAATTPIHPGDHVIAACNPRLVHQAAATWFPSRWLVRRGQDGADLALLEAVDPADLADRYHRVVIGSGDHAFAPLAQAIRALGLPVWVVARAGSLSRDLARASDLVAYLHPPAQGLVVTSTPDHPTPHAA